MKLRNKKTGEIVDLVEGYLMDSGGEKIVLSPESIGNKEYMYGSLAELNAEWEDYEESEDFWYIDDYSIMCGSEGEFTNSEYASFCKKDINKLKQIGNYFETKEKAEEAVEKLKAWKRLEDKGFSFYDWTWDYTPTQTLKITAGIAFHDDIDEDLDLLFGG